MTCLYCGNNSGKRDSRGGCVSCGAMLQKPNDHRDHFCLGYPKVGEAVLESGSQNILIGYSAGLSIGPRTQEVSHGRP